MWLKKMANFVNVLFDNLHRIYLFRLFWPPFEKILLGVYHPTCLAVKFSHTPALPILFKIFAHFFGKKIISSCMRDFFFPGEAGLWWAFFLFFREQRKSICPTHPLILGIWFFQPWKLTPSSPANLRPFSMRGKLTPWPVPDKVIPWTLTPRLHYLTWKGSNTLGEAGMNV